MLAVPAPHSTIRTVARDRVRDALRGLLAPALGLRPEDVPLCCEPGETPCLPGWDIGIGIAHEAGLSLVAALRGGRVGVDLMRIELMTDWEQVAHDYLGPRALATLYRTGPAERPLVFATLWTRAEAVLKCHGRQLAEWSEQTGRLFSNTHSMSLALPKGYAGHVAWPKQ